MIEVDQDEVDSVLSRSEKERAARFAFDHLRWRYRLGCAVLRKVLSTYLDQEPGAIALTLRRHGKPFVQGGPEFNMSNSGSMLLIGVGGSFDLGVDVERRRQIIGMQRLAQRYFSVQERASMAELAPSDQLRGFLRVWVQKEAVCKAVGLGLRMNLPSFSVPLDDIDVSSPIGTSDDFHHRGTWYVHPLEIFEDGESALAASRPMRISRRIRIGHGLQWTED